MSRSVPYRSTIRALINHPKFLLGCCGCIGRNAYTVTLGPVECLAQALGFALLEDFRVQDGRVLTPHFSTYLLPTALDMPTAVIPVVLELADPHGPFGARGVAELPLVPFAPAVAAAIHDATGVWLSELPMTPERVLAALAQAGNG